MGLVDSRVTLEEMISGFRTIRREWATVKAEESGRAVLAKVVRLMERAGMSLERWFRFMDMSQVNTSCDAWLAGVSGAHQTGIRYYCGCRKFQVFSLVSVRERQRRSCADCSTRPSARLENHQSVPFPRGKNTGVNTPGKFFSGPRHQRNDSPNSSIRALESPQFSFVVHTAVSLHRGAI